MIVVSDTSPITALLAKRAKLIPSARMLLEELNRAAGIYLTDELKETALKTVGE